MNPARRTVIVEQPRRGGRGESPRVDDIYDGPIYAQLAPGVRQPSYQELVDKRAGDRIDRQHHQDRLKADDWHTYGYTTAVMARALLVFMLGFGVCLMLIKL